MSYSSKRERDDDFDGVFTSSEEALPGWNAISLNFASWTEGDLPMRSEVVRARIFVSCGQNESSNEREIAAAISTRLREMGFDPYVAFKSNRSAA